MENMIKIRHLREVKGVPITRGSRDSPETSPEYNMNNSNGNGEKIKTKIE